MDIYTAGIRPLLFSGLKVDPERLHHQSLQFLSWLAQRGDRPPMRYVRHQLEQSCCFEHPTLTQQLWGLNFPNPLGLAAGFDKDGVAANLWPSFGFGFAELGTVTLHGQPGNPTPRLFRLPADQAVLNRMGFNNLGAAALATQLGQELQAGLVGINLGKSKLTPLEQVVEDYVGSFQLLRQLGDYFVVNVSSPNTPGLRSLQATEQLAPILAGLQQENPEHKPILVKIAPDLDWEAIAAVIELAQTYGLAGLIATNTTIRRDGLKTTVLPATGLPISQESGGISGAPLRQRSTEVIRFIYRQTQGQLPIIGVGGIFTAEDAWEKLLAGASLVQVYTGWIYEGPWMVRRILQGLAQKLADQGVQHIADVVGSAA